MIYFNRYINLIVFSIFIVGNVVGQNPQYSFRNYTSDDGLPSSEVHEALQDKDGFMWFGTDNGLSKFDGYNFKNYSFKDGLKNPVVFDLHEDDIGNLWILTMSGNIYIKTKDSIEPYVYNHIIQKYKDKFTRSSQFDFDKSGNVYISLLNYGIIVIDNKGNHRLIIPPSVGQIILDSMDINLYSTYNNIELKRLDKYDKYQNKGLSPPIYLYQDKLIKSYQLNFNYQSKGGSGYQKFDDSLFCFWNSGNYMLFMNDSLISSGNSNLVISCNYIFPDGDVWLGSYGDGVNIYPNINDLFTKNYKKILDGTIVSDIYKDDKDGIWVLSVNKGIYYCPDYNIKIFDKRAGLLDNHISTFDYFDDNKLVVGIWDKGIQSISLKDNSIVTLLEDSLNLIYDIKYIKHQNKLIANEILKIHNGNTWNTIIDHKFKERIGTKKISSRMWNDKTLNSGHTSVSEFNLNEGTVEFIHKEKYGISQYFDANYDMNGNRWVSDVNGLWQWSNNGIIRPNYMHPYLENRIEAIEFLSDNTFVLGTKGNGVIIWDGKENLRTITTDDGLTADMIENIYIDSLDNIWVGTLNGLNKITHNSFGNYFIKQYTKKHGLPSNEITKVKTKDDKIYIATVKGLCILNQKEENQYSKPPLITNILINGNKKDTTHYSYTENNLIISFVSIDYKADGDILYRYRLQNDEPWQMTKATSLNFNQLFPKKYKLEIQAQNEDGYWSKSTVKVYKIHPPFWLQLWFPFFIILCLGIFSYIIYSRRLNSLKQKQEIKEKMVELERNALSSQMNPHFIFNILNSIQSAIMQHKEEEATNLLSKFAKLIRTTLNNSRKSTISIESEIEYLESYLLIERVRFGKGFEYTITKEDDIDDFTQIPPMLIQPFVENAIKHGLSKSKKGEIKIRFFKIGNILKVSIKDNGVGFRTKADQQTKSLGMKITQERLTLLNNDTVNTKNMTVSQIRTDDGQIAGTEIEITLNFVL